MAKVFYLMKPDLVNKFGEKKDELIQARTEMKADEVEKAKAEILYECNINEIKKDGSVDYSIVNGIAIIPVTGMLVDYVDICMAWFDMNVTTYGFIRQAVIEANNNQEVKAILLDNNSGGGFVTECEETFQMILNSEKPVFSMVHDMSASADYWLAAASDEIISVSKTGFFGSIGVAMEIINYDDQEKKEGIKRIVLTNTESKDKRPNELTKKGQQVYIDELDALYNVFANSLIKKRKKKLSREKIDNLNGTVLISDEAIKYGLADRYMLQQDVIPYIQKKIEKKSDFNLQIQGKPSESFSNLEKDINLSISKSFGLPSKFLKNGYENDNKATPAGEKTEDTKMTLKEFLAQNPDAKMRYLSDLKDEYNKGVESGKADIQKRIDATINYIGNESYAGIEPTAKKVLKGESEIAAIEGAVAAFDMLKEQDKSKQAKKETDNNGDTPPDSGVDNAGIENQKAQEQLKKIAGVV